MKISQLSDQYSVSEQITEADVDQLASLGVKTLICNRPDNEAADQTAFAEIAQRAEALGIKAVSIAFTGTQMSDRQVSELATILADNQRVHAYCRTGNRSTKIWQAVQALTEQPDQTSAAQDSTPSPAAEVKKPTNGHCAKPIYTVVIVGAGTAGIAVATSLLKRKAKIRICLIDPAEQHAYQPGWTMVGGGVFDVETTQRPMHTVIPDETTWLKNAVTRIDPDNNRVHLDDGSEIYYNHLVVAAGLEIHWAGIKGLPETLGKNGVTSNYSYKTAPYTWELVSSLKGGKAVFTQPPMPIKCAGAPQKAMYLAASHWRRNSVLDKFDIGFYNAGGVLFGVPAYVPALQSYVERYAIHLNFLHNLIAVDGDNKTATFTHTPAEGEAREVNVDFDMLHVCPPQRAPEFIRNSPLADAAGWVDVHPQTLQHTRFNNVWGLGDVTNTPNAKTMAAARKQAPLLAHNICATLDKLPPSAHYNGYGSCPLTVEHGKIVLAEFGYEGKLLPTFPTWINDGTKATSQAWHLKADFLPWFYWNGMLKGREWLV